MDFFTLCTRQIDDSDIIVFLHDLYIVVVVTCDCLLLVQVVVVQVVV